MIKKLGAADWLFILVSVLGIVVMIVFTVSGGKGGVENPSEELVKVVYYSPETADFVIDSIKAEDKVSDDGGIKKLGKVRSVTKNEAQVYVDSENGKLTAKGKEAYSSLYLETEAEGELVDNGVKINGTLLGVGHTMVVRAGKAKIYVTVYAIEKV